MSLMHQDIQLKDTALWQQLKMTWRDGDYNSVLNILKRAEFDGKQLNADAFNTISEELVELQNQKDLDFKADKIKMAHEPPSDLTVGEVYFRDLGGVQDYNESDARYIEPNQKTTDGYSVLNFYTLASQSGLTKGTIREFGISNDTYTLDKILYDIKMLLDYVLKES